jgi:drug/metabolite transporter (DMT)-like permease
MAGYTVLLYVAIGMARTREQVITVTVANYLWPSLTLLFSVPLLGWRARPILFGVGTLLAWSGVALAVGVEEIGGAGWFKWEEHATTTIPALLAAVAWGLYSNVSRRWGSDVETGAMPVFLLGTGLLLLLMRCFWEEEAVWSGRVIWEAAYLALFPTLLAYVFWDKAARRGDLTLISALSYLTPLISVGVSGIYLGVAITGWQWLAGVLVVAGAVLCKRSIRSDQRMS